MQRHLNYFKIYINILLDYKIFTKKTYNNIEFLTADYLQLKYINYYRYINKNYSYDKYKIPEELLLLNYLFK